MLCGPVRQAPAFGEWRAIVQYNVEEDTYRVYVYRRMAETSEWLTVNNAEGLITITRRTESDRGEPQPFFTNVTPDILVALQEGVSIAFGQPAKERELQARAAGAEAKADVLHELHSRLTGILERILIEKVP